MNDLFSFSNFNTVVSLQSHKVSEVAGEYFISRIRLSLRNHWLDTSVQSKRKLQNNILTSLTLYLQLLRPLTRSLLGDIRWPWYLSSCETRQQIFYSGLNDEFPFTSIRNTCSCCVKSSYLCWLLSLSGNELSDNNGSVFWNCFKKALSGSQSMFQLKLKGRAFVFETHSLCIRRISCRFFYDFVLTKAHF